MTFFKPVPHAIVVLTFLAASTTNGFAHEGHSHVSSGGTHEPPSHLQRNDGLCGASGCCSAGGSCSLATYESGAASLSNRTSATTEVRLEQLSLRMRSVIRSEMQGSRNYNDFQSDSEDVLHSARRLRDNAERRASDSTLLADARRMLAPLKRMNTALRQEGRSTESLAAVQDVGRLLVSYGRDLQAAVSLQAGNPPQSHSISSGAGVRRVISIPDSMKGVALLPTSEQAAALDQRTCPVTKAPLGSMGRPVRVAVAGRSVYVCCDGCVSALRRNPDRYLSVRSTQPRDLSRSTVPRYPEPPASLNSNRNSQRIPQDMNGVALLPVSEQAAALRQKTCPVNGEPLGSMGKPVRVDVAGRSIYVCCAGCVNAVKRNPQKYLR